MSRKQEIYGEILRLVLIQARCEALMPWWKKIFRKTLYHELELVHNLCDSMYESEFANHDIWFLNNQARYYCENTSEKISSFHCRNVKLISEMFELVPIDLHDKLKWNGPRQSLCRR